MSAKTKEIGGGAAVGLSNDVISGLQQLLNTGGLGTAGSPDAAGTTGGVFGVLSDILSGGGGKIGGSLSQLLSKQTERDVNAIRARFGASGGAAFGTPAAFAESQYRAEAAPRAATAIGELQLQALAPLLQGAFGLSQLGIAPRQLVQQKSGLGQALGTFAQIGGAALPFLTPSFSRGGDGGGNGFISAESPSYNNRPGTYFYGPQ